MDTERRDSFVRMEYVMASSRRIRTRGFKKSATRILIEGERGLAQTAKELGANRPVLSRWRKEAKIDLLEFIEAIYNRRRRHSSLGFLSPEKFEKLMNVSSLGVQ